MMRPPQNKSPIGGVGGAMAFVIAVGLKNMATGQA
jgi:hypothetical protein